MMICHDDVDPKTARMLHHVARANAGVDRDDQANTFGCGILDYFALHAVTVANAVGNETLRDAAG